MKFMYQQAHVTGICEICGDKYERDVPRGIAKKVVTRAKTDCRLEKQRRNNPRFEWPKKPGAPNA